MAERLQIVWTPWRDHTELLTVRDCFFPPSGPGSDPDDDRRRRRRRKACDQVSVWKRRGNLPHALESTWLLTEAILLDDDLHYRTLNPIPTFAIKASYITAISRFVTTLLDAHQDTKYKISMYAQARRLDLPALFVDLRHEVTHGEVCGGRGLLG